MLLAFTTNVFLLLLVLQYNVTSDKVSANHQCKLYSRKLLREKITDSTCMLSYFYI